MILQIVFMLLLATVLVVMAAMGIRQYVRTGGLARESRREKLRFASDDPFDIPRQYGAFALLQSGHSPRASNVSYGLREGRRVRAFDFRYEVAHGTRRATRHYEVVVIEADNDLPEGILWHASDANAAPLHLRQRDHRQGEWLVDAKEETASLMQALQRVLGDESLQCCGNSLMLFRPAQGAPGDWLDRVSLALQLSDALAKEAAA